ARKCEKGQPPVVAASGDHRQSQSRRHSRRRGVLLVGKGAFLLCRIPSIHSAPAPEQLLRHAALFQARVGSPRNSLLDRRRYAVDSGRRQAAHRNRYRVPLPPSQAASAPRNRAVHRTGRRIDDRRQGSQRQAAADRRHGRLERRGMVAHERLISKISGLLDPRIGRGFYNSFHAEYFFLRFPLDHFFHSTHFRLIELKRLAYFGSDHFPMFIRLSYEPEAERQQGAPQAHASDEAEAREKIEEASTERKR